MVSKEAMKMALLGLQVHSTFQLVKEKHKRNQISEEDGLRFSEESNDSLLSRLDDVQ